MPRRKKTEEEKTIVKEEQKQTIGYKGNVSIKVVKGNTVVKRINVNNTGNAPMFKFLANCLKGTYEEAQRPKYINLFNQTENKCLTALSTPCSRASLVSVPKFGASLEFIIPAAYIVANKDIDTLKLYSSIDLSSATEGIESADAAAEVSLGENTFQISQADAINTTILITWTLLLTNTSTITSNQGGE